MCLEYYDKNTEADGFFFLIVKMINKVTINNFEKLTVYEMLFFQKYPLKLFPTSASVCSIHA